jgi:transcriptional regulator
MHPNHAFDWADRGEMLAFVAERGFAHIFVAGSDGLRAAHAPLLITAAGRIQFHLARRNRAASFIDGSRVLLSISALDAYHSANWYASDDQVPTWHYQTVEIEGPARAISTGELVDQLDGLSAFFEARFQPRNPWTRDKMDPRKFEAFTRALTGFEVEPEAIRGTRKFNQHKPAGDIDANIRGQRDAGRDDIAETIERLWPGR